MKFTPDAETSTSSWAGPTSGVGRAWISSTSGPPFAVTTTARISSVAMAANIVNPACGAGQLPLSRASARRDPQPDAKRLARRAAPDPGLRPVHHRGHLPRAVADGAAV